MTQTITATEIVKAVRKNPEPKMFSSYDEKVEKYNLKTNWFMYSNIKPPKRGGSRESVSDAKNIFMRASLDKIFSRPGSLRESWRVGVAMFDGGCYLCGKKIYDTNGNLKRGVIVQADHIIPPLLGGTISAGNMAPAHRECNDLKADTLVGVRRSSSAAANSIWCDVGLHFISLSSKFPVFSNNFYNCSKTLLKLVSFQNISGIAV